VLSEKEQAAVLERSKHAWGAERAKIPRSIPDLDRYRITNRVLLLSLREEPRRPKMDYGRLAVGQAAQSPASEQSMANLLILGLLAIFTVGGPFAFLILDYVSTGDYLRTVAFAAVGIVIEGLLVRFLRSQYRLRVAARELTGTEADPKVLVSIVRAVAAGRDPKDLIREDGTPA
jgi:hypothetical protein